MNFGLNLGVLSLNAIFRIGVQMVNKKPISDGGLIRPGPAVIGRIKGNGVPQW